MAVLVTAFPLERVAAEQENHRHIHEPYLATLGHTMSKVEFSVALAGTVNTQASVHLLRLDGQEDLCFAIWFPSVGRTRTTALLREVVLPIDGERSVHGNASFVSGYLERALGIAAVHNAGLALLHSHPDGYGWQGMSRDDVETEQGIAASVWAATELPLVGLTLAGDGSWSARFWNRTAPRLYERKDCGTVRVIADDLRVSFNNRLAPPTTTQRPTGTDCGGLGRSCSNRPYASSRRHHRSWKCWKHDR